MNEFVLFGLVILSVFFIFVGYQSKVEKKETLDDTIEDKDYGSKRIDVIRLVSTLFTVIGAGEYGLAIFLVAIYGFWGTSFLFGLAVALFIISLLVNRIWQTKSEIKDKLPQYDGYKSLTTPDYLYAQYGSLTSVPATLITVIAFWGLLVLQFVVGGELISVIANIPTIASILIMFLVITIYTLIGGFSAIFHTDFWQKIFMWIGLLVAIIYIIFFNNGINEFLIAFKSFIDLSVSSIKISSLIKDPNIIILFIITVAAAFGGPDLWQRVIMAKSRTEAKKGAQLASYSIVIFAIVIAILGIDILRTIPLIAESGITQTDTFLDYIKYISSSLGMWTNWVLLIFSVGLISAFISTADTSVMLVYSSIQNEFSRNNKTTVETSKNRKISIVLFITISAVLFSIATPNIAKTFTAILGILGVMGIPVFFSLFGIGNKTTAFLAMVLGTILVFIANFILPPMYNDGYYLLIPFIPGFLLLLAIKKGEK